MTHSLERARTVKQAHENRWLTLKGVVAVGIGQLDDGRPGIIISVEADSDRIRRQIPEQVEGVPVEIRVIGPVRAQ